MAAPANLGFDVVVGAPFGGIGVRVAAGVVTEIVYLPTSIAPHAPRGALASRAARQISAYLKNPRSRFSLPLVERGTDFQRRVWRAVAALECGQTATYGAIAKLIKSGPRAVGQACGANWFPLVIPCHRVLASSGIGGFARHDDDGFHLGIKRWLLAHEGVPGHA